MLKANSIRESTKLNYVVIWRQFNTFLIRLDSKPKFWEDKLSLFCAYLVDKGVKSTTLRSYCSAIKHILVIDGYDCCDSKVLLTTIVRACRIRNDVVITHLPIHISLLEALLFELKRIFENSQLYLFIMYKALLCMGYYGLMRIRELTLGSHTLKACNIHITENKNKILMILYSSKTHSKESKPQKIKISENELQGKRQIKRFFCPFRAIRDYLHIRGVYLSNGEQFFILADRSPVSPSMVRNLLQKLLKRLNINPKCFNTQSLCIGRATDLIKFGVPIEVIKLVGCWKSNAVYRYLKP